MSAGNVSLFLAQGTRAEQKSQPPKMAMHQWTPTVGANVLRPQWRAGSPSREPRRLLGSSASGRTLGQTKRINTIRAASSPSSRSRSCRPGPQEFPPRNETFTELTARSELGGTSSSFFALCSLLRLFARLFPSLSRPHSSACCLPKLQSGVSQGPAC